MYFPLEVQPPFYRLVSEPPFFIVRFIIFQKEPPFLKWWLTSRVFRSYRPKTTSEAGAFCAMIGELLVSLMTLKRRVAATATKPGICCFFLERERIPKKTTWGVFLLVKWECRKSTWKLNIFWLEGSLLIWWWFGMHYYLDSHALKIFFHGTFFKWVLRFQHFMQFLDICLWQASWWALCSWVCPLVPSIQSLCQWWTRCMEI